MKRVKQLRGWGIYQNSAREIDEYGFSITVIHPDNLEIAYMCGPSDTDMEFDFIDEAISWIENYD